MPVWAAWWVHEPPSLWMRIGGFNLVMAMALGLFFGLGLRHPLCFFCGLYRRGDGGVRSILEGGTFLALGVFYGLFAWPMLVWDRPARALAAMAIVLLPLAAILRGKKNPNSGHSGWGSRLAFSAFVVLLTATSLLTLLRTGFITLKGDRVPLLLDVTGETRLETVPTEAFGRPGDDERVTAHRVIIWLPNGEPAIDVWVYGDKVAVEGRAVLFSSRLNALAVPNLYELLSLHNGAHEAGGATDLPFFSVPFPQTGSLAVHPWWRPFQMGILAAWRSAFMKDSLWAILFVDNESPYYPLVGPERKPLKQTFLLDLTLDGIPTSRGSSPFERP
jgi:hypothetical protein